jgi:hypothetical protein
MSTYVHEDFHEIYLNNVKFCRSIEAVRTAGRPDRFKHVSKMGTREWIKTSVRINSINPMLGEAFKSVAHFLEKSKNSHEDWHLAPIWGHSYP